MPKTNETRILTNDDGWILSSYGPPITIEDLRDKMIGPHAGSPIDTFLWSVGGREVFSYETEIGERFAQDIDTFENPADEVRAQNLRHLCAHHGGPVTAMAQLCHEIGMKFFPSLRMNTHYNTDESSLSFGRFRRDHPEWLIGRPGENLAEGSLLWGLRTGKDYAFPQVRDFMNSIAFELLERFDCDGIELDFMRHPGTFRPEQAFANRYLLTDMVRQLRQRMDEIGKKKGRQLELAVRVAPTLADSERLGIEAEVWIKEGLADLVITGLGFNPFEARVAEFVRAAEGTRCRILGCYEALRPLMDTEVMRAIAARYWDAGASGFYFFNFFCMPAAWKKQIVGELADPGALSRLDKMYEIDKARPSTPDSQIGHAFRYCLPLEQLPLRLENTHTDRGAVLRFDIVDDLEGARADGALAQCVLGLGFQELDEGDELTVQLNGQLLEWPARRLPSQPWTREGYDGNWGRYPSTTAPVSLNCIPVEFEVDAPPLRQGNNQLEIRLLERRTAAATALVIQEVQISIRYKH
jgi:hypothetical protein